jgi:RNA polymerase sigma-70 factor (ECF subfamily)
LTEGPDRRYNRGAIGSEMIRSRPYPLPLGAVVTEQTAPPVRAEHELVRRAQEYDPEAFGEIYERYYNGVYKYIYYRVGDQHLAEDLTMEVFVKTMEAIDGFTFRGVPFSAWLYRIASNLVVDHFRRQPAAPALELEERLVSEPGSVRQQMDAEFTHQALRRAVADLTEDQQQVIILKFVDGLSNQEVAHVLGKSEGAIKSLQHRALASLGRVLGEDGEAIV